MVDLILMLVFSWQIHKLAGKRGLSAWVWVSRFISGYFLFGLLVMFGLIYFYGKEALTTLEGIEKYAQPWTPFILLFLVVWFIFLRSRIMKYTQPAFEEEIQETVSKNDDNKPDLSYFR